ncbi:hypothetical protein TSUD_26030 [Trifolium subterraneum]|uniref:CCHC-type domain-containing protein n=1 Tax=Trifolium subterraneum TaxID=3900 RepID=A0A2Z6NHP6_TRISU|nr:hypothetical protein TSUD_26030 [Trifolium subterraneum]
MSCHYAELLAVIFKLPTDILRGQDSLIIIHLYIEKDETLCEDEESLQEDDEEELAFLSRRIQRLMTRRNQLKKNFQPKRNGAKPEVDLSKIQCYGCNQFGHYKNDCRKNKQKKPFFKKKSMMATWDDLEEAQSEDEEQEANVCLMTHSNAEEVTLDPCSSCQKTEHLFDNLLYDSQILNQKNAKLRYEITVLTKERDEFKKESSLKSEVIKDELPPESCFVSLEKDKWIWHKRAGHVSMKTMSKLSKLDLVREEEEPVIVQNHDSDENPTPQGPPKTWRIVGYHPPDQIIGNTEDGVRTRKALQDVETILGLISQIEPRSINEAIIDEFWIEAMKEELHQFEKNEVWNLVPFPKDNSIIGTRWVFRNKLDENGKVVRNKARLVAQGYNQQEGIDYDETFAPVDSEFEMSMMGELGFFLGLQIKQQEDGIFISQEKYVNDLLKKYKMNEAKIMSTPMHPSTSLDKDEKGKDVSEKEYRGMIGSLLYLTASRPDIVFAVGLCARFQTSPKESHLIAVKRIFRYLVGNPDVGLWYKKGSHFDLQAYCDADYAGDKIERKSTSGACQFLGEALVSWCCRKQNTIALSTTEAEYVAASNCCSQVIWIKNQLEDFSLSGVVVSVSVSRCLCQSPCFIVENPPNPQTSPNTVFQPSQSESPENSPINLTQNQSPCSSPTDSPKQSPKPTNEDDSPSPTATISSPKDSPPVLVKMKKSKSFDSSKIRSPKDSPPVLVKMKKSKSFDSSKIRRSSRIMSGAGKKPVVDTTVHVLDQSDSEIDPLDKEIGDFELEPVTSTKSEPVKPKKSPTPKKKEVETAVKAPRTKKKVNLKKSKAKLLPAPLIQPEDEEIFDKYWNTKLVAVSRLYNFAELSIGGVDLVKFVEPFEWKSFFHIKETIYLLLVQAFYFNAQVFPEKDMITSNIKDVELVVDPYVIGSLIGIKSEGLEVYGNDWYDQVKISKEELKKKMFTEEGAKKNAPPSSMLKTEYKLLHNMCQHSFFPRIGSKDKVTDLDLLMMYHMAKGVKLNLPYIIVHHMIHVATSGFKKIALPYAMLLTRVFRLYYADMDNTPSENHYYTFSLKNVSHMKKVVETPAADVRVKRKRDVFEKTSLNVLADASGDRLENDLQTDGHTQTSGDVDPTTESDKVVTTVAATLQGFKPFIRNILTSDTPEISTMPIPNPTGSTLPSIPSSFATFDSFCSSVNAANAGTKQLVFEGNINVDFPGPSRPAKRSRLETDMEQMRKDLDSVIKGMAVQYSMMDYLILESKTLRTWFTSVVCPQLHLPPPPEIETPQFDSFPATNDKSDDDDCPTTSPAPHGATE